MRLIRGSGMRGLGAVHPRITVEDDDGDICGEILRPLLATRRKELEAYLQEIGQSWRDDATNEDEKFTRNRIRKLVVPVLEKEFNPSVTENLAELAEIARGEEDYWENEVAGWMGTAIHWSQPDWVPKETAAERFGADRHDNREIQRGSSASDRDETSSLQARIEDAPWLVMNAAVDRMWFLGEPVAVQRRAVKAIGEQAGIPLEFKHVEEVLFFAAEEGGKDKQLSLPLGWKVAKNPDQLIFLTPDLRERAPDQDYEYDLSIPGRVVVREAGLTIEANRVLGDGVRGIIRTTSWTQILCPDCYGCGTGAREIDFGRVIRNPPRRLKSCCRNFIWLNPGESCGRLCRAGKRLFGCADFPVQRSFAQNPGAQPYRFWKNLSAGDVEK